MNIYNIDIGLNQFEPRKIHYIDLDSIVSISPVSVRNYTGYDLGISHADYFIYVTLMQPTIVMYNPEGSKISQEDLLNKIRAEQEKLTQPVHIRYNSGTCLSFPDDRLKEIQAEQDKLISAWKATKETHLPSLEDIHKDTQISDNLPISNGIGFRDGRRQGILVCYEYILKSIRK
jgi:hypothetical protein